MGTTQQVAKFITGARFEDIPEAAVEMAKLCLLDVIGCALHASTLLQATLLVELVEELGGRPRCHVLGTHLRTNALDAAMANAMMGHLDDFDDMGTGHHATLMMPVVLALGEELQSTGRAALAAYIVGFDITAYTTLALGPDHKGRGWHQTSTAGVLGCAAAACRLQGLDEMQTRMALGIASSHAGGIRAAFGTATKALHPANAVRAGLLSAKLAARGYESNPGVLEDRFGFFAVFGEQSAGLPILSRNLGNPWAIMGRGRDVAKGIVLKRWPSCGYTHAIATVLEGLLKQHRFSADDVEAVEIVTTNNPTLMAANIRWPKTPWQGKYSPWYTAASHIVDGKLDISSFTQGSFDRPAVQDLMKRVSIIQHQDYSGRPQRALGGEEWWDVAVKLKTGARLVAERFEGHGDAYGWDDREAVFRKFTSLAAAVLPPARIDAVINETMELEKRADLSVLMTALCPPAEARHKTYS